MLINFSLYEIKVLRISETENARNRRMEKNAYD